MLPDHLLPDGRAPSEVDDQPRHQVAQIEATVESVGESGQVVGGVLAVLKRVVSTGQRGLEVAQHGVDPQELRQISGLALTDDHRLVGAACGGEGCATTQTVAEDCAAWGRGRLGPLADGIGREAADPVELQESGPVLVVQRHGGHERDLVLRAPARLAAGALATEVGVVAAKELGQRHAGLELDSVEGHRVHSVVGCTQATRPVARQMSLAEAGC